MVEISQYGSGEGSGRVTSRPTLHEAIAYAWSRPLDFPPGTEKQFSHWGYQVLGRVIEKVSGVSYDAYMRLQLGLPVGMRTLQLAGSRRGEAAENEIWYVGHRSTYPEWDFNRSGPRVTESYAIDFAIRPGAGSLIASAADMCRFYKHFWHNGARKPSALGRTRGASFFGSLPGTWTYTHDSVPSDDSHLAFVVHFNERVDGSTSVFGDLTDALKTYLRNQTEWPQIDLFENIQRIPPQSIIASGDDGNGPANVDDGHLGTRWSAHGDGQWVELDFGRDHLVHDVAVAFFRGNRRTASFDVQLRADGESAYTTSLANAMSNGATTHLESFRLPETQRARYVRLVGHGNSRNLWNSLTEIKIFGWRVISPRTYQAEHAIVGGGSKIEFDHRGFNGSGFVNFPKADGFVEWANVQGGSGGLFTIAFRYALGGRQARTAGLLVNTIAQTITFHPTGSWSTWNRAYVQVNLRGGIDNTIIVHSEGEDSGNIDELIIGSQAEDAQLDGGVLVESDHQGFNGTGFINFPRRGGAVEWSNIIWGHGENAILAFRYALGRINSRTCELIVNGVPTPITFGPTGGWNQWATINKSVVFNRGADNTVRVESTGEDCGNIDDLLVTDAESAMPLRVMSFNVRFDSGRPSDDRNAWMANAGTGRGALAISVIREAGPDILGVQEALGNQVADLQAGLPTYDFYGVGRDDGDTRGEYMGIFYRQDRFARIDQGTFWLSYTPETPSSFPGTCCRRIASWVILEDRLAGHRTYFVLNTHWDHQIQEARILGADVIRERVKSLAGPLPLIVLGDLNAREDNEAFLALIGEHDPDGFQLLDSYRVVFPTQQSKEATFHGFNGTTAGRRIDYILYSDDLRVQDAAIIRTHVEGRYPSDHFPVTALLLAK